MTADSVAPRAASNLPLRHKPDTVVKTKDGAVFDLVATYNRLLAEDQELSMPVAAIEALIELLSHLTTSTVFETVEIVKAQIAHLKSSVPNPIPPTAGAELFTRTLLSSLRQETKDDDGDDDAAGPTRIASSTKMSFEDMRQYLVRNSRGFAAQAKAARAVIADVGARYVTGGSTVLTTGGSRCVKQLLLRAADRRIQLHGSPDFRVIYVMDGSSDSEIAVKALREHNVPVATVDVASAAHAMRLGKVNRVFVGAEAVCQRGGVLSRMGTYQLALLANEHKADFYVVTETHKFAMVLPLDQNDVTRLGVKQKILEFKRSEDETTPAPDLDADENPWRADYTPPEFVKAFITEQGTKTPASILEFVLRIYAP
ncbi:hypothetical protein BD289DRAFT_440385 [Coniella lustricola]|uniref:Translation initiation factor eIF2B subunit alpha n=1 Tax=Coniella lustricola TaxID=2025994 RepID=A0A2T3A0P3_9PEZI|nr:hypothetical protein BD289DRAFT_440385 [Coniella lustricola]